MNVLVCVKRVPAPGTRIVLTEDQREIETKFLGFAISPHEECAVEAAIQLVEQHGGEATVLTLGPEAATEQLRYAMAQGIDSAILLETDGSDWGPTATARAITAAVLAKQAEGTTFDVLLFGNESADSGGYQVGIRVAHALDLPCLSGVKELEVGEGQALAKREVAGGREVFEVALPAVFTVKEGINYPRYPSLPGRLRAKKKPIDQSQPQPESGGLEKIRLVTPPEQESSVEILGDSVAAVPKVLEILKELGMV